MSPVSDSDLNTLIELGLVEMSGDTPALTQAGKTVLE
jgi:hypothetical protein